MALDVLGEETPVGLAQLPGDEQRSAVIDNGSLHPSAAGARRARHRRHVFGDQGGGHRLGKKLGVGRVDDRRDGDARDRRGIEKGIAGLVAERLRQVPTGRNPQQAGEAEVAPHHKAQVAKSASSRNTSSMTMCGTGVQSSRTITESCLP